jgi:large subunit ribosomal protein L17
VAGRKLGRTSAHRQALLRNMSMSLFRHERIRTTVHKAKELRPFVERLITRAKSDTVHARRVVARDIHDRQIARKLFETLAPRYVDRPGGYTRILRLGSRPGDGAEMAFIELVDADLAGPKEEKKRSQAAGAEPKGRLRRLAKRVRGKKADEPRKEPEAAAETADDTAEAKPAKAAAKKGAKKKAGKKTAKKATATKKAKKSTKKKPARKTAKKKSKSKNA